MRIPSDSWKYASSFPVVGYGMVIANQCIINSLKNKISNARVNTNHIYCYLKEKQWTYFTISNILPTLAAGGILKDCLSTEDIDNNYLAGSVSFMLLTGFFTLLGGVSACDWRRQANLSLQLANEQNNQESQEHSGAVVRTNNEGSTARESRVNDVESQDNNVAIDVRSHNIDVESQDNDVETKVNNVESKNNDLTIFVPNGEMA